MTSAAHPVEVRLRQIVHMTFRVPEARAHRALTGIVSLVGTHSDRVAAPMVRAYSSCAPSFLSSIWNRARLAPLNKFAR